MTLPALPTWAEEVERLARREVDAIAAARAQFAAEYKAAQERADREYLEHMVEKPHLPSPSIYGDELELRAATEAVMFVCDRLGWIAERREVEELARCALFAAEVVRLVKGAK